MALFAMSVFAATSTIALNNNYDNVEFWDAVSNSGHNDWQKLNDYWCNGLNVNSGSADYTINLYIDDNFSTHYPAPEGTAAANFNLGISGINLTVKTTGILNPYYHADGSADVTGGGDIILRKNANLYTEGNAIVNTQGSLIMKEDGEALAEVKDNVYFFTRGTTEIGSVSNTTAQILRIIGSDVERVYLRNLKFIGGEGVSAEKVVGGKLEFIADANGITTIEAESKIQAFSGVIEVDFTNLIWNEEWGDEHKFTLVQSTSGESSAVLLDWISNNDITGLSILKGVSGGEFSADNTNLYLTIAKDSLTIVPEPSTYAAIFGALALAFAAYRRRK